MISFILLLTSAGAANECITCTSEDFLRASLFNPLDVGGDYVLQEFNASVFNQLEDVHLVMAHEADIAMTLQRDQLFLEMSQILLRHGLNDLIGASILHNHFYVDEAEVIMLNSSTLAGARFEARPVFKQQQKLVPYMFKVESTAMDGQFNIYPLQYIHDADGSMQRKVNAVFAYKQALLEIAHVLDVFEMMDKVGIFIDYEIGEQQLSEVTNVKARNQSFNYVAPGEENENALITHYSFNDASCIQAQVGCEISCHAETICREYDQGHDNIDRHGRYHD